MVKPNYHSSQQELYAAARTGWNSCSTNLPAFIDFKTKYTSAFIKARMQEIDEAENLPDEEQREELSRTLRVQLSNTAAEAMAKWQRLKRYIIDAFPEDEQEIKFDAAGQAHYRRAAQEEWSSVQRLIVDGNRFIADNQPVLVAEGSMPDLFITGFADIKNSFDTLYQQYLNATVNNPVQTQSKITTNNNVYAKLMNMFLDGQELFRNNEAVRKLFTFDQVALTIGGPGVQGLKGDVTQPENLPVANAEITFTGPTIKKVTTDEDGRYDCPQLKEGDYTVMVIAVGFQPITITGVEVATGIMRVLDVVLVKN